MFEIRVGLRVLGIAQTQNFGTRFDIEETTLGLGVGRVSMVEHDKKGFAIGSGDGYIIYVHLKVY